MIVLKGVFNLGPCKGGNKMLHITQHINLSTFMFFIVMMMNAGVALFALKCIFSSLGNK